MRISIWRCTTICCIILLIAGCGSSSGREQKSAETGIRSDTVLVVDLGLYNNQLLHKVGKQITLYYGLPVVFKSHSLPKSAFLPARARYDAPSLLQELKSLHLPQYRFVAGLTASDISMPKNSTPDFGIFGLGSMDGGSCISSIKRLKKNANQHQLEDRIFKVVLHEIGHNYGVPHCTNNLPCFMKDAKAKISTVDNEPMDMCASCKKKMKIKHQ